MNINDYLIDQSGKDWGVLLQGWMPPLTADFTLWLVNRLGELIISTPDGSIHWLDAGANKLHQLATSREQFAQLLDHGNNADKWLRISLIDACRQTGMTLASDECYGFKIPPILQGQYEVTNLQPTKLAAHYSLLVHLGKQEEIY
ncbi:MAG TPA: T6SS immunity protein Tdi1 domain-containing protein, partial [Steroidobacteraceae bacterium]|nr:T6SS immunity protein Tdi1 domain-containing protein [Steroidobacteraceae bacterium]